MENTRRYRSSRMVAIKELVEITEFLIKYTNLKVLDTINWKNWDNIINILSMAINNDNYTLIESVTEDVVWNGWLEFLTNCPLSLENHRLENLFAHEELECSYCFNELGESVVRLTCNNGANLFHKPCIIKWLKQIGFCTFCRQKFIDENHDVIKKFRSSSKAMNWYKEQRFKYELDEELKSNEELIIGKYWNG